MARVLIADDDPGTVAFIEALLKGEGYRVDTAADGKAALEKARLSKPDVLITDIRMPGLTGNQLAAAVRGLDRLRYVYILVLTSAGEKPDKMKALLSGADDFLVKPARPGELLGRIEVGLRLQRAENEAREASRRRTELGIVFRALAQELDLVAGEIEGAAASVRKGENAKALRCCEEALAVARRAASVTRIRAGEADPPPEVRAGD